MWGNLDEKFVSDQSSLKEMFQGCIWMRWSYLQGCSGPLFPATSARQPSPQGAFPWLWMWAGKFVKLYIFCFIFLFTSSSPCHKDQFTVSYFSTSLIVLIQVYNWEIRHHSLVCCCGLADILYFSRTLTEFMDFSRRLLKFKTFSRVHEPWLPSPTHWQAKIT